MHIVRILHANRMVRALGLLGLLALLSGCDSVDPSPKAAGQPTSQEQQDAERQARLKAYGKTTIPGKTAPKQ
jgi:hypothetical protein